MNRLMNHLIIALMILPITFISTAFSSENVLDIDSYNKELRTAIGLYKVNNYNEALFKLEIFAKRGDKTSQYIVGTMYLNAQGTKQDLIKSYGWLTVANEQKTQAWELPLTMLQDKLPADYLEKLALEGQKYIKLYGAKSQRLKCKNVKKLGSKQPSHRCNKIEIVNGYYFVDDLD
ncbi:sel1 repeat family protein [Colwellia sp. C1TZA3]|uniref:sel1 repeat family protein n=1 Tax=Colwellia sp. C1TZA3 TaxID=2508879 RepID=UPI0011B9A902|nr:sel1 repeat family protein [Colwellia sp. C1TZA3]TWX73709.1 sel1 repeat family protein [Colwellia sp. C1TZA3]